VQDAALVGVVHRPRHRRQQTRRGPRLAQRGRRRRQAPPRHQLHAEEVPAVDLSDFVERHDVRVVQRSGRLGLRQEPPDLLPRREAAGADHLQGHVPVEPRLPRAVHRTHPTLADLFQQLVVAETGREVAPGCASVAILSARGVSRICGERRDVRRKTVRGVSVCPVCGRRIYGRRCA
jgi:hypothetical protein